MPKQDQYMSLCEQSVSLNIYNCLYVVETVSSFLVVPVPSCPRESMAALARLTVGRLLSCLHQHCAGNSWQQQDSPYLA